MRLLLADGVDAVAAHLAGLLSAPPKEGPALVPLPPAPAPRRVVAVDGSSLVLAESGDILVAAHRWGRVRLVDGRPEGEPPRPPRLEVLTPTDGPRRVAEALRGAGADAAPAPLPPAACLDALRTLGELAAAREALRGLGEGDLLLLDGPLKERPHAPVMGRLLEEARRRGVDVAGVCKSTRLTVGGAPAVVACQRAAQGLPSPLWCARLRSPADVLGHVFVARLSPAEPRPFRVDVHPAGRDPVEALARLAPLAGHPAYPGYPSPLAMAHNAALLAEEDRVRLRGEVVEAVLARGVPLEAWEAAFLDYHEVLELGA